jgi:hypothetical protein
MQAFEFEVDVVDGVVQIPRKYTNIFNKHIKIIAILNEGPELESKSNNSSFYTDEYVKNNWKQLLSIGLAQYNENYYRSEEYKDAKGAYLMEKNK